MRKPTCEKTHSEENPHVRKPTIIKAYICLFVCLTLKVVHLELVFNLTTEEFIVALHRFVARRGHPSLTWSNHGTNFIGANWELKEFQDFLSSQIAQRIVSEFCNSHNVEWKYIPERFPHFGGLWELVVKSTKTHLKCVVSTVKLTFNELTTVLTQIEICLNSCLLTPINTADNDGIEVLTPGHFSVGKPLTALPDPQFQICLFTTSLLDLFLYCIAGTSVSV